MPKAMPAQEVLDREFLELRAKILELAASLDRLDRGDGSVTDEDRFGLVQQGLRILLDGEDGRAERVQLLFSQPFPSDWRRAVRNLTKPCRGRYVLL